MAKPTLIKPTDAPTVLHLVADMTGCTLWRVLQPTRHLESLGYKAWWGSNQHDNIGDFAAMADVLVLPRLSWPASSSHVANDWFRLLRSTNKRSIYEVDDDLFTDDYTRRTIEAGWLDGKTLEEHERDRLARIWALQQCDAVITSTPALANVIRAYTSQPIHVVPNAIDLPWFQAVAQSVPRVLPMLTIGWAGGRRADSDVAELAVAWGRLARRYPELGFVVYGWTPKPFQEHVPTDRLFHLPWQPLDLYPAGYRNIDIGCATVVDSPFNQCKTVIKAWEYVAAGAPVVASHALYGQWIKDGSDGLLATTADEWEAQLARLVEDKWLRQRLQRRALRRVEQHEALAVNAHRWVQAWVDTTRRPAALVA